MSSSPNKLSAAASAALFLAGCGLVDLRELEISVYPSRSGTVLPASDTPLRIAFAAEVDRNEAEDAFSVTSPYGAVEGDAEWADASFSFVPAAGWLPGLRYRLALSGAIRAVDGREARPDVDIDFYAVRSGGAPILIGRYPAEGESVGVDEAAGAYIRLEFSEAMDKRKTEDALAVSPSVDFSFSWNDGGTILRAVPREALSPCAAYRWTLSAEAAAADGAPLARDYACSFATDADAAAPFVLRTFAALRAGNRWIDSGCGLSALDAGQAIGIEFSEPIDPASLIGAVSFFPSLPGRIDPLSETAAAFVPDRTPDPETETTLVVSSDVRDRAGLSMGAPYRERFVPAVPYLRALSVETGSFEPIAAENGSASTATVVMPDGSLSLSIRFSLPFDLPARVDAVDRVTLAAFFPVSLSSPALRSAAWTASDTLVLSWEGLEPSPADRTNWYLLTLPGGRNGLGEGTGLHLREDLLLYLEAAE